MIIAVDCDGTLADNKQVNTRLIGRLIKEQRKGNQVILWTCRSSYRLAEAIRTLSQHGLRPDYVNANTPDTIRRLGYDPRKVLADVYIDDKNA